MLYWNVFMLYNARPIAHYIIFHNFFCHPPCLRIRIIYFWDGIKLIQKIKTCTIFRQFGKLKIIPNMEFAFSEQMSSATTSSFWTERFDLDYGLRFLTVADLSCVRDKLCRLYQHDIVSWWMARLLNRTFIIFSKPKFVFFFLFTVNFYIL